MESIESNRRFPRARPRQPEVTLKTAQSAAQKIEQITALLADKVLARAREIAELAHDRKWTELEAVLPKIALEISMLGATSKDFAPFLAKPFYLLTNLDQRELLNRLAAILREEGVEDSTIAEALGHAGKRRRGRPVERSYLALEALELKEREPTLKWSDIAKRCGYDKERLRRDVVRLRALLRKHSF